MTESDAPAGPPLPEAPPGDREPRGPEVEPEAAPANAEASVPANAEANPEASVPANASPRRPRDRRGALILLIVGLGIAGYFSYGPSAPRDNTVRFVLGERAEAVSAIDVRYMEGDETIREASFRFRGDAPRVTSHEVKTKPGTYRLEIDIETRNGKKSLEKDVRLEGGTTQVDLVPTLVR